MSPKKPPDRPEFYVGREVAHCYHVGNGKARLSRQDAGADRDPAEWVLEVIQLSEVGDVNVTMPLSQMLSRAGLVIQPRGPDSAGQVDLDADAVCRAVEQAVRKAEIRAAERNTVSMFEAVDLEQKTERNAVVELLQAKIDEALDQQATGAPKAMWEFIHGLLLGLADTIRTGKHRG